MCLEKNLLISNLWNEETIKLAVKLPIKSNEFTFQLLITFTRRLQRTTKVGFIQFI